MQEDHVQGVVRLSKTRVFRTFRGRDIFVRAAAELEKGTALHLFGDAVEITTPLDFRLFSKKRIEY